VSNIINDREELSAGQMLGRYELLMPIAKGGMGNVWAARLKGTRGFCKLVAVKTVVRTLQHPKVEQMLFQEAMLASQIHHPNVAETLELGEHEGTLYLVMELVSGESLSFVLREAHAQGGIPVSISINVIAQVCRGLAAAHDLRDKDGRRVGLVHRDISPPNIMITEAGTVKIVDFGVATTAKDRSDSADEIKGKVGYFAPEQLRGEGLDERVDVFATGILLYLLTVGRHPFRTSTDSSTMARIVSKVAATTPSALVEDYPDALEPIVMRALHKDRQQRYQSSTELLEALENAFPEAFGPRADEAAGVYLRQLMKDRLLQRSTTLRMAEELAERYSHSHSAYSLPGITTSSAPLAKPNRSALFGVAGVAAGLGMAALMATQYVPGVRPSALSSTALAAREPPAVAALGLAAAGAGQSRAAAGGASALGTASPALPAALLPRLAPRTKPAPTPRSLQHESTADTEPSELLPLTPAAEQLMPAPAESTATQAENAPAPPPAPPSPNPPDTSRALQVLAPTPAVAAPPPAPAVAATPPAPAVAATPPAPAVAAPPPAPAVAATPPTTAVAAPPAPAVAAPLPATRAVSSRLGRSQLLSNPATVAPSVRLPAGLDRMGQTFSAIVNVCVSATGHVSKVSILRSAGPALDAQIPRALSRWRYRPLLEDGKPTPFCYVLNYEIAAR